MKELAQGFYATRVYLPLSYAGRHVRDALRRARGTTSRFAQVTRLPRVTWRDCTPRRAIRVWEPAKRNGNVRLSELAILSAVAAEARPGTCLFEIGTFDGRTTLNLALASDPACEVHTLDLPPDVTPKFALAEGERHMVEKPVSGARYAAARATHPAAVARICQHFGDSAQFDFTPFHGRCGVVFVDGSHEHDCVVSNTRAAMRMAAPGGVVLWHDYGVWDGVTRALEDIEAAERPGFRHIRGTSLVFWRRG